MSSINPLLIPAKIPQSISVNKLVKYLKRLYFCTSSASIIIVHYMYIDIFTGVHGIVHLLLWLLFSHTFSHF